MPVRWRSISKGGRERAKFGVELRAGRRLRLLLMVMREVSIESLRQVVVENCMVKVDPSTIGEETPLFGPDSLGLDSLDALQIAVAVEKLYGVSLSDSNVAREALQSLGVLRDWIIRSNRSLEQ